MHRHNAQGQLFTTATNPNRWCRFLDRLRITIRTNDVVILALICGLGFCPHTADYLYAFAQHTDPVFWLWKLIPVGAVFIFIPARTNPPLQTSTRDDIDC